MTTATGDTALGAALRRAHHAYRTRIDHDLRPLRLTAPQYAILQMLSEQPGASSASLARTGFVTPQTMQGIVTKLEREQLIERRAHPHHPRLLEAKLTDRGARMLVDARAAVLAVERLICDSIEHAEQATEILASIAAVLSEP